MAANNAPIYTLTPDVSNNNGTGVGASLLTATGDYTGVSVNHVLEHTAGVNGSYVKKLKFKALGTNVATVARIFLNNGSAPTVATNNTFFGEKTLAATTASAVAATAEEEYTMDIALPAGWRIYVGIATTVAAGWNCVAVGGQY